VDGSVFLGPVCYQRARTIRLLHRQHLMSRNLLHRAPSLQAQGAINLHLVFQGSLESVPKVPAKVSRKPPDTYLQLGRSVRFEASL